MLDTTEEENQQLRGYSKLYLAERQFSLKSRALYWAKRLRWLRNQYEATWRRKSRVYIDQHRLTLI